jgi:hypothetical protein
MYVEYRTTPIVIFARNGGATLFPTKVHPWFLIADASTNGVNVLYSGAVPARMVALCAFAANSGQHTIEFALLYSPMKKAGKV